MPRLRTPGKGYYTEKELKDIYQRGYEAGQRDLWTNHEIKESIRRELNKALSEAYATDLADVVFYAKRMIQKAIQDAKAQSELNIVMDTIVNRANWDSIPES